MRPIVITAGHSSKDPGAVGGGMTEADICTDFRNLVAHYLKAAGVAFVADGKDGENLPLSQAIGLVKKAGKGCVAVEFHCNASANPAATGVESLSSDANKRLGSALCQAIADTIGIKDRGAKGESAGQHSRLGFVQAGGVILELFFISNPQDLRRYLDKKWLVARAVAWAIINEAKEAA